MQLHLRLKYQAEGTQRQAEGHNPQGLKGDQNVAVRAKLNEIAVEYETSSQIQNASTKMLNFLVNDILDLS